MFSSFDVVPGCARDGFGLVPIAFGLGPASPEEFLAAIVGVLWVGFLPPGRPRCAMKRMSLPELTERINRVALPQQFAAKVFTEAV